MRREEVRGQKTGNKTKSREPLAESQLTISPRRVCDTHPKSQITHRKSHIANPTSLSTLQTQITKLFNIQYPIIQAGMIWAAGNKLASAVSRAGGFGLIGSGSMKPDVLREHIRKAFHATDKPFGVNIPLLRGDAEDLVKATVQEGVKIIFTSAGTPAKFTPFFKERGCLVVHVISAVKHALKAEEAGCDAVVAEGFEAGGHNGIDEITTLCLVPQVVDAVHIPVIAAGGIADGRGMLAALSLGAEAVQVGTRFAATIESSAHENYKKKVVEAADNATVLTMKKVAPVRLIKNNFALRALEAEKAGATKEEMLTLLGSKRERAGIFEGDMSEGEFEAGQSSGLVHDVIAAGEVVERMMREYREALEKVITGRFQKFIFFE